MSGDFGFKTSMHSRPKSSARKLGLGLGYDVRASSSYFLKDYDYTSRICIAMLLNKSASLWAGSPICRLSVAAELPRISQQKSLTQIPLWQGLWEWALQRGTVCLNWKAASLVETRISEVGRTRFSALLSDNCGSWPQRCQCF